MEAMDEVTYICSETFRIVYMNSAMLRKLSRSTILTNIEINQDIQADCGLMMADPTQIHQIAVDLILPPRKS